MNYLGHETKRFDIYQLPFPFRIVYESSFGAFASPPKTFRQLLKPTLYIYCTTLIAFSQYSVHIRAGNETLVRFQLLGSRGCVIKTFFFFRS